MKTFKLFVVLIFILEASRNVTRADFIFGEPTKVPNINSASNDSGPQISRDGLELYLTSQRAHIDGECYNNIWVSKRATTKEPWSEPAKLDPPVNSAGPIGSPCISADGLELYFGDGYPALYIDSNCEPNLNGYGGSDLWVSTRDSKDDLWGVPINIGPIVNSIDDEDAPSISADGLSLYFMSNRSGGYEYNDLYVTTRPTKDDPWGEPVNLGPNVNSEQADYTPFISPDGLSLFFSRGYSKAHVFVSRRTTIADAWGPAEFFTPVNSGSASDVFGASPGNAEFFLSFSKEDTTLYFSRGTTVFTSDYSIWQVEVTPKVDLNEDGVVDALDVCIMVERWHTYDSLCDIAPAPLGDGFVDVQDLTVLAEHLFESLP